MFDAATATSLLIDGVASGTYLDDAWAWNGSTWTNVTASGTRPSGRAAHGAAYDITRERLVLFGGTTGTTQGDTWEWDGTTWSQPGPPTALNASRVAFAYDAGRGRVVIFGGDMGSASDVTREWTGTAWIVATPSGSKPPARRGAYMTYDARRKRIVLFGGESAGSTLLTDTWTWDGTTWTDVTPALGSPPARYSSSLTYDTEHGVALLFGGSLDSATFFADLWGRLDLERCHPGQRVPAWTRPPRVRV